MHRLIRRVRRAAFLAVGATVVLAVPAGAHPFVAGGEVPVDSLAEVTLTMAHGCGTEDSGGGDPTVEVAMEVPENVRIVTVDEVADYEAALERDTDGRVEVVTWTATGTGVAAPEVSFDAVFAGEPATQMYLKVFQGCDGFTYRWIGTPDEPAEDPAIGVQLVAPDPDNPPPPDPDNPPPPEDEDDPKSDPGTEDTAQDPADGGADDDSAPDAGGGVTADDDVADDDSAVENAEDGTADAAADGDAAAPTAEDDAGAPIVLWVLLALGVIGVAAYLMLRPRSIDKGASDA